MSYHLANITLDKCFYTDKQVFSVFILKTVLLHSQIGNLKDTNGKCSYFPNKLSSDYIYEYGQYEARLKRLSVCTFETRCEWNKKIFTAQILWLIEKYKSNQFSGTQIVLHIVIV